MACLSRGVPAIWRVGALRVACRRLRGVVVVRLFSPPTFEERVDSTHPLWRRTKVTRSTTVLKAQDGLYKQYTDTVAELIDEALIAFLGGHVYLVDSTIEGELIEAGYGEWLRPPGGGVLRGYGSGKYGAGKYGVTEITDPGTYGDGLYGDGIYGE